MIIFLITALGAIFGSYCTIFIYRIPKSESCFGRFFGPKSRCGKCGYIIPTRQLIPLLNWLFTRGSCQNCGIKIPKIFLFAEITMPILFVISYLTDDLSELFVLRMGLCFMLVLIFAIFWQSKNIPIYLSMMMFFFIALYQTLLHESIIPMVFSLAFSIFFGGIFYKIFEYIFSKEDNILELTIFILLSYNFFNINIATLYLALIVPVLLFINFFSKKNSFLKFGVILIGLFTSLSFFN